MRIAIADDQHDEIAAIAGHLSASGHACVLFANGAEVVAALRRENFDLLLLDWNMPRMTGIEVLAWTRQFLAEPPPVIILTGRGEKIDIIEALELGASDYIRKPEDPEIVRARVKAAVDLKSGTRPPDQARFGGFELDDANLAVRYGDEVVSLRRMEFDLVRLLFENLDRPLSRAMILQKVWHSNPEVQTRTLDVHISRIRAKLNLRPERGFSLKNVFGYGYRLDSCPLGGEGE